MTSERKALAFEQLPGLILNLVERIGYLENRSLYNISVWFRKINFKITIPEKLFVCGINFYNIII